MMTETSLEIKPILPGSKINKYMPSRFSHYHASNQAGDEQAAWRDTAGPADQRDITMP